MSTRATVQDSPLFFAVAATFVGVIAIFLFAVDRPIPEKKNLFPATGTLVKHDWCKIGKGAGRTVCVSLFEHGRTNEYAIPFPWPDKMSIMDLPLGSTVAVDYMPASLLDSKAYIWELRIQDRKIVQYEVFEDSFRALRAEDLKVASFLALLSFAMFAGSFWLRRHFGGWCSDAWLRSSPNRLG